MADDWSPTAYYVYGDIVNHLGRTWALSVAGADYVLGTPPDGSGSSPWAETVAALPAVAPTAAFRITAVNTTSNSTALVLDFDPATQVQPISQQCVVSSVEGNIISVNTDFGLGTIFLSNLFPATTYNISRISFENSGGTTFGYYNSSGNLSTLGSIYSFTTTVGPPVPITNLALTPGSLTSTSFAVTWSGGGDILSTDYFFALNDVNTVPSFLGNGTATFSNLAPSTPYTLIVTSDNGAGIVVSQPLDVTTQPAVPQPAVAPITSFTLSSVTGNTANFAYVGGANATSFSFLLNGTVYSNAVFTANTVGVGGLFAGLSYTAQIILDNGFGPSQQSAVLPFSTSPAPDPAVTPITTLQVAGVPTQTAANLLWAGGDNASSGVCYVNSAVYPSAVFNFSAKTVALSGLTQSTLYNVYIVLDNSRGLPQTSPTASFSTSGPTPPPVNPPVTPITSFTQSGVATTTSAVFTWSGGANATLRECYLNRFPTLNATFSEPNTVTLTGLSPGSTFNVYITLDNNNQQPQSSSTIVFSTAAEPPPTPSSLTSYYVVNFLLYDGVQWVISQQNTPDIGQWFLTGPVAGQIQNNTGRPVINYLKGLQAQGCKIILSMGGGGLTPALLNVMFADSVGLGNSIANTLLSKGVVGSNPLGFAYAGSDWEGFAFDGFDMDVENNTPLPSDQYVVLNTINQLLGSSTVLLAAPQAPNITSGNPFGGNANGEWFPYGGAPVPPDGPLGSYTLPPINTASSNGAWMDPVNMRTCGLKDIFIQFYNQGPTWYPGEIGTSYGNALAQWAYLCLLSHTTIGTGCKIVLGFATNDGSPIWTDGIDSFAVNEGFAYANDILRRQPGFSGVNISDWCAGIGFWNSPSANSVAAEIYTFRLNNFIQDLPIDSVVLWQANQVSAPNPDWLAPVPTSR